MSVNENGPFTSSKVFLPSIRELFPEQYAAPSHRPPVRSNMSPTVTPRQPVPASHAQVDNRAGLGDRLARPVLPSLDVSYKTTTPHSVAQDGSMKHRGDRLHPSSIEPPPVVDKRSGGAGSLSGPRAHAAPVPTPASTTPHHHHHHHHRSQTASHSFTVLRSDPATSSLEHVASSVNLQDLASHQTPGSNGIQMTAAGVKAVPSFRVAMQPPVSPPLSKPKKKAQVPNANEENPIAIRESEMDVTRGRPLHINAPRGQSSQIPGSDHASRLPSSVSSAPAPASFTYTFDLFTSSSCHPNGLSNDGEGPPGSPRGGRRHTCQICNKRFNRPSSLRIHETTHTGIKPFQCQWPGCGRLFNVNSNMRRHYRNHVNASNNNNKSIRSSTLPSAPSSTYPSHDPDFDAIREESGERISSDGYDSSQESRMDVDDQSDGRSDSDDEMDDDMDAETRSVDSRASRSSWKSSSSWSAVRNSAYPEHYGDRYGRSFPQSFSQSNVRYTMTDRKDGSRTPSPTSSSTPPDSSSGSSSTPPTSISPPADRLLLNLKPATFR